MLDDMTVPLGLLSTLFLSLKVLEGAMLGPEVVAPAATPPDLEFTNPPASEDTVELTLEVSRRELLLTADDPGWSCSELLELGRFALIWESFPGFLDNFSLLPFCLKPWLLCLSALAVWNSISLPPQQTMMTTNETKLTAKNNNDGNCFQKTTLQNSWRKNQTGYDYQNPS